MNQKIDSLIKGGFISLEDVLEYSQQYMDAVDRQDDERLDYEMSEEEKEYERMRMLDDMYGEPTYDSAGFTEIDRESPDYIVASVSRRLHETFIFKSDSQGCITDWGEYGGLAYRWGDDNWEDHQAAVRQAMGENNYTLEKRLPNSEHYLYIKTSLK